MARSREPATSRSLDVAGGNGLAGLRHVAFEGHIDARPWPVQGSWRHDVGGAALDDRGGEAR